MIIIIISLLNVCNVFSVTQNVNSLNCDTFYTSNDSLVVPPKYECDIDSFIQFNEQVARPIPIILGMVPAKARVLIEFNVDKQGQIFAPAILKIGRVYYDREQDDNHRAYDKDWKERIDVDFCTSEAIRILKMVKFIPAQINNTNVCYEKMVTIINVYYATGGYD